MERTVLFLDIANLECSFRHYDAQIDYVGLRDFLAEGRFLVDAFVYLPISPYEPNAKDSFIDFLSRNGFYVRSKLGKPRPNDRWKCNFNVEMAVDMLHFTHHGRAEIVVLGSGNGDMIPVCHEMRMNGVRCEVAATRQSVADDLLRVANGFIDLGEIIKDETGTARRIQIETESGIPVAPGFEMFDND